MSEHDEQAALFQWVDLHIKMGTYPGLEWLFAIPNGAKLPFKNISVKGKQVRICPQARYLLAEGLRPGVPDCFLPVAKGGYHGLFIEHKFGKNKVSPEQSYWLKGLDTNGYLTAVSYNWTSSVKLIVDYLNSN